MFLVLGVPCLFWGPPPSQVCGIASTALAGAGTEQALAAGQWCVLGAGQVAEGKSLSHTDNRSVSADGDGDRDHAAEDEP